MEEQKSMTAQQQQQGGAVAKKPQAKNLDTLKRVLNADSVMTQFKNALSKNASTFVASLIDLYSSDSKLQLCDPNQVVKEALKAAVLHLPINKALGQAFIIPYYNTVIDEKGNRVKKYEPVFQIGYKGLYQLAMRTGKYAIINADVVYEGELQRTCKLTGEIDVEGRKVSENVVGYFAYIQLVDGYHKALYMSVEDMAAHAKRYSKAIAYNKGVTIDTLLNLAKLPVNADSFKYKGFLAVVKNVTVAATA
jgi:recombination protein RecT